MAWALETAHIADLDHEGHGADQLHASKRAQRIDHRGERPIADRLCHGLLEPFNPLPGVSLGQNHLLQHCRQCRMVERLFLEPAEVAHAPGVLAWIISSMAKHHGTDLLALARPILNRGLARPNKIPKRFMSGIRHPDLGQLAGAQ